MFESYSQYSRIVVVGPHRSGTTIAGACISRDTGYCNIREEGFGWSNEQNFKDWLGREQVVLQAPFMTDRCHYFNEWTDPEELLVVCMLRPVEDIRASQRRLEEYFEAIGLGGMGIANYRLRRYHTERSDASIVYENWAVQKARIAHWREVEFASLAAHPLFIDDRSGFHFRQTA